MQQVHRTPSAIRWRFGEEAAFEEAFYFPRNESALDDKVLGDFHSTETFTLNFILLH